MRRAALVLMAGVLFCGPSGTWADGWRSADRPQSNDHVVDEPPPAMDGAPGPHDGGAPADQGSGWQWHGQGQTQHQHRRRDTVQGTQPYWGTMHPYWNAPEEPGVIHRGARSAPLKVRPRHD